jgi:cellulose biosynthesis protein BcsQ
VSAQASRSRQTLDSAKTEGIKYAFIDTAGRKDESALSAARAADLVLIPSRPRGFGTQSANRLSSGSGPSSNEHDKRRQSASQNSQSKPMRNRGQKTWRFVLVSLHLSSCSGRNERRYRFVLALEGTKFRLRIFVFEAF